VHDLPLIDQNRVGPEPGGPRTGWALAQVGHELRGGKE
jgi:hypothetical protein